MQNDTYIDDYISPAELTWYAREVPQPANLILDQFLGNQPINHLEAEIGEIRKTNRAARFRSWDTPVGIGKRDTFESHKVKIPPLGQKLPVGEYEMLQLALARTGGNDRAAMIEAIYDDTDNNVRSIYNRIEIARGDVLMDGKFTLADEDGLTLEADFGLPTDNNVTPTTLWNDADDSTPLTNLRAWMLYYAQLNGTRPGYMLCGEAVISALETSEEVRQAISYGGSILKPFVTDAELAGIFATNRFPTIVPYDTVIDWNGTNKRVIDENKVIFLPPNPSDLGFCAWGITAEALALMGSNNPQLTFQQAPGIVAVTTREGDPPRVWTKAGATAMPLIKDIRKLMVATVLPAS
jgi:hypothetical protein